MKIEILENIQQKKIVDIELPYYFKDDLYLDSHECIIYGKVEEKRISKITINTEWGGSISEIQIENHSGGVKYTLGSYYDDRYKSSKSEFENAKQEALAYIGRC